MKRFTCLFVLFLIAGAWAQLTRPVSTRLFQLQVPGAWEDHPTPAALYLVYPGREIADPQSDNISVTPTSTSAGMGLDSFTFMAKFQVEKDYPELTLSYSKPANLGKLAGHRFEYKGQRNGKKYILIQVMALSGLKGYTVQFTGTESDYNSLRSQFEAMLRSFKENA